MDNPYLNLKDAALVVQPASTQTSSGTSVAAVNAGPNNCFDLAMGATLIDGAWAPGGGGWEMNLNVPVTSFNASSTLTINASGGTYTLTATTYLSSPTITSGTPVVTANAPAYSIQTTTALAYNANASTIALALAALTNAGNGSSGLVTVTGTGPYTVTFNPSLGAVALSCSGTSLTGGGIVQSSPTYSFVVNQSPDGTNWQAASPVETVGAGAQTEFVPSSGGIVMLPFRAKWRYLQLSWTISGNAPGIVLQDSFITPYTNAAA